MNLNLNQIIIELPYPIRVGFFYIDRKKKVGFSFDNMALFMLRENLGLKDTSQLNEWVEKHSANELMIEQLYAAHESFCHWKTKKPFDKSKFMDGLGKIKKQELQKIVKVWDHSELYGSKKMPGKKKVARN